MRIAFFLSSLGGNPLQVGLARGLTDLGHTVCSYEPGQLYDLVTVFNQTAHVTDYIYPPYPALELPVAFVDCAEYGYFKRLPGVIWDYANAFAPGSMNHDTKDIGEQEGLRRFLQGRSFPYFLREFSKYVEYPGGYHPIDYPLYASSVCATAPDRDEYLRRDLELFVSWGASHPWRMNITDALSGCHTKCEIRVLNDQTGEQVPRMPQAEYFARTEAARCSVSFDGYGSGSFRMTEVLVRTLLLQGPLSIVTRAPLVDGETCVAYGVEAEGAAFVGTDVCEKLRQSLGDPEGSFEIYRRGFEHCMEHLTERATAEYFLRTVEAHDWSQPTELRLYDPAGMFATQDDVG